MLMFTTTSNNTTGYRNACVHIEHCTLQQAVIQYAAVPTNSSILLRDKQDWHSDNILAETDDGQLTTMWRYALTSFYPSVRVMC
jgi:hypothetical protein